ncbi:hypothetical protein CMT41_05155 [Colwellia sp. MT41]|uniref:hypothetical protein n=1 Tax=Colwellia sp. MT41 TaxID=58049 RepID=UPI000717B16B|nr:hypothetical protein [Colwellia sp. MT41]ALO34186.1 hypothetical protein CMT41_05155 [Colwellia sp. MT41]
MKYLLSVLMIVVLSACQSATELQSAYSKGLANSYSCGQITSALAAYEADKTSFATLKQIAEMSGLVITPSAETDASSYYENVKSAATVAMLVQGCPPIT